MSSAISAPLGTAGNPLKVVIVGSGPSGFYAAEALLKTGLKIRIDMIERLPAPFGLVRYGVAPDHPKLKQPTLIFDKIAQSPEFTFFGNVTVGKDISLAQLQLTHHAVIFACGAETDRRLGLLNEDLPGSHTATEFVGWYNGHPDYRDRSFDLSAEVAVIVGQGNVAADVARILSKPVDDLRHTDIAQHALDALSRSRVRDIHIIGRRGPAQASFTAKELRELGDLPGCTPNVSSRDLELGPVCLQELDNKQNFNAAGNIEIFRRWATPCATMGSRRLWFHFLQSPVAIRGSERVQDITLERNRLTGPPFHQTPQGTGQLSTLPCGLLFRSIGYRGVPLPGVPFDHEKGVFQHSAGRVGSSPGLYAAGWIKRGPSGIIGTNRADSVATVQTLLDDLPLLDPCARSGTDGLLQHLASSTVRAVNYADWQRLDREEQRRGAASGKPREKIANINDMLAFIEPKPVEHSSSLE